MVKDEAKLRNKLRKISDALSKLFEIKRREKSDPLDILIATILSQNTNDLNSHKAFKNLKDKFPDFESLANADLREIERAIKVGGLARQKAKRIKNLLIELKKKHGGF